MNAPFTTVTELFYVLPDNKDKIIKIVYERATSEIRECRSTEKALVINFADDNSLLFANGDYLGITNNGEICRLSGLDTGELGERLAFPSLYDVHTYAQAMIDPLF